MSIRDEIKARANETPPRLHFLAPLVQSAAIIRELFVSTEVIAVAHPPWPATLPGRRHAQMRAYLDAFTEGRRLAVANDPYRKPRTANIARVDPPGDEVFAFRCIDPKPGIRVFGCFAAFDLFVALTWRVREDLPTDAALNREWRDEVERCKAAWRRLFNPYRPHAGATLDDYLSNCHAA